VVGVSRSTLERKFRQTLGCTLHDEICRTRLQRAQQLIREGQLSLRQIAARTGFCHLSYFTRFFRQATGQTPAAYRRALHPALAGRWTDPSGPALTRQGDEHEHASDNHVHH
jgi:LacI family transcriptional regulator